MTVPHFLPELFPQPETFDIDRYRSPRNAHRQHGAYAPFGLGEHICLGSGSAEIQLMVITATLLHTYEFALEPPDYQLAPGQRLAIEDDVAQVGESIPPQDRCQATVNLHPRTRSASDLPKKAEVSFL